MAGMFHNFSPLYVGETPKKMSVPRARCVRLQSSMARIAMARIA
jgi:hypothetical protein